ncbi:MAG: carbon starvation protein A [Bacteroidota bacterium]|nr:carbon starvation protein A [Bacteroidota bacterium]
MNSIVLVIIAALFLTIGYGVYGRFVAHRVLMLNGNNPVPSVMLNDGRDYVPTNKIVLMGHHFAAIAGAGPLIGPVLAAQYGFLPGVLWILIGSVFAGAVHDMVILTASVRFRGKSIAEIAKDLVGNRLGLITSVSVITILIISMAGLGIPVINALKNSPWGTFTVGFTIPVALFIGIYMKFIRPDKIFEGTVIGVLLILLGVVLGPIVQNSALGGYLNFDAKQMSVILAIYGFFAAALPVWLLLLPRDYLSTYMKLGVIGALALGIIIIRPEIRMPAFTQFVQGGGPIIPGKVFPFLFITIACGALSGFHSLISSGTTPKLIKNEKDILPIGFGAMLIEAFVGIMALLAATVLPTSDYFAINTLPEVFAKLHMIPQDLPQLSAMVGENLAGRPGGSVSLAVGMTYVFQHLSWLKPLMGYWYHFCIMFEALFILTTIDAGTRIGRYLLQDLFNHNSRTLSKGRIWFNAIFFSAVITFCWGYLLYSGNISTIWPLFGTANQMLAVIAFAIGTTYLLRSRKLKYIWVTLIPLIFAAVVTLWAAFENIFRNYLPKSNYTLAIISGVLILLVCLVLLESILNWVKIIQMSNEEKNSVKIRLIGNLNYPD